MLTWLNSIEHCYAVKINKTGIYDPKKKVWRKTNNPHSPNGIHDIIFCYKSFFGSIEVKAPGRKPKASEDQLRFMSNIHESQGWSIVSNDLFDLKARFISHFGAITYKLSPMGERVLFDELIESNKED